MLTRELAIVAYEADRAIPDQLTRKTHAHYFHYAQRMCDIYRHGKGRTRQSLHREIQGVFANEENCPPRRIGAFCKLLDEVSTYERDEKGKAAALRRSVFRAAAAMHPLMENPQPWFENQVDESKRKIAASMERSWLEIDNALFSDVMEFHTLIEFTGYDNPASLLARYNVAQYQVALYDAVRMQVWARDDFKWILRYAKLARLMHRIERRKDGSYRFDFDGPASLFRETHRYGVAMARFLPGLLACSEWKMKAQLKPTRWYRRVSIELDSTTTLSSPVPAADEFDSKIEEQFFHRWGSEPRNGWRLERESEVLHRGQKVFVPDFVFVHENGKRVFMELVGFWTPEYLKEKLEILKYFEHVPILLAIAESTKESFTTDSTSIFYYKTVIRVEAVLELLEKMAK